MRNIEKDEKKIISWLLVENIDGFAIKHRPKSILYGKINIITAKSESF